MALDGFKNLAVSAVATAPSPAISGTSLVVTAGHGSRFPTPPFNVTISAAGVLPDPSNAEIARCTAIASDTLTITRAAEGPSGARTILVGDLVIAAFTAKWITDLSNADNIAAGTLNTARLPTIATLTGNASPVPQVRFQDLGASAGTQVWRLVELSGLLQTQTMSDDQSSVLATPMTLDRSGNAKILLDIYEKGRTTPIGHWIDVAFSAGNFTSDSGTFVVDSGDVQAYAYALIGKTLILNVYLTTITITGSPTQLRIAMPGGFTIARGFQTAGAIVADGAGAAGALVGNLTSSVVVVTKPAGGSFTPVTNGGSLSFTVPISIS